MTNLRIEYWVNDEKFAAEVDVDTAMDAALWKDWCVDEDIRFYIDNEEVTDRQDVCAPFAPSAEQHEESTR